MLRILLYTYTVLLLVLEEKQIYKTSIIYDRIIY